MKSIIFDTETTGLKEEDKIIQVGAIVVEQNSKEALIFDELCSSEIKINIEAMAVHGIREDDIKDKSNFKQSKFLEYLNSVNSCDNYLIAHNLDFDLEMLKKDGFINKFKLIDTYQCARHLYNIGEELNGYMLPNYKLQTFRYMFFSKKEEEREAKRYNLEIKAHDAIGDVLILKLFIRELYQKIMAKYNLEAKDYIQIMDKLTLLTNTPVEIKILIFGKHKGKSLNELEKSLSGSKYIDWLFDEQKKQQGEKGGFFDKNLFYTLEKIISNREKK